MSLDKPVNRETGEKVLKFLTKAVERIPETYPLRLAEAFRSAAEISEALGNKSQAFDYYQLALQKNPKLTIKKRLNALKKELVSYLNSGLAVEQLLDLWGLFFVTNRDIWYDEEEDRIHYEEAEAISTE